jgi:NAD(P)-dependent dehydrogenase (short-subunit alcohol dehydrogenase family)
VTPEDVEQSFQVNVAAAFAFSRQAILTFKENQIDGETGKRGALVLTGATASLRGNVFTSAFSSAKFASRSLSQSLNKEFGKDNIHVCHYSTPLFCSVDHL